MNEKVALISSYCDNDEKINLLTDNIVKLKSLGIDIILFTPFRLTQRIYELCDVVLFSKENPVLDWPEKSYFQWWDGTINGSHVKMTTTYPDYGYAGLVQIKRMADLAISMGYKHFYPMIYDININEHVISIFEDSKKNSFFPSMRDGQVWGIGLHLMSLDFEHMVRFKNLITKESYLVESDFDAFAWLHRAVKLIPGVIESTPVEDLIYYFENKDFFDCSIIKGIKCFIHKTPNQKIKIIFYGFGGIKRFNIYSDSFQKMYSTREWEEIELPFEDTNILKVLYEENEYDFTQIIKKIKNNIFEKK